MPAAAPGSRLSPSARTRALPVLCALVLGLVVLGPALADPTTWLAGEANVDAYGTWWFQWWVAHALATGVSPFHADVLFYPFGKDILRHTGGNVLDVALLAPLRWLAGPVVAWNALVFATVATNALAAGAWARRIAPGLAGVLAAQVVVGLHPFVLEELRSGRPTQAILAPLLLALCFGDEALRTGDRRATAASAALLALTGWVYWYAASFGALALCVLAVGPNPLRRLGTLTAIGLGSLALTSPLVVPLARALANGEVPGLLPLDRWWAGAIDFTTVEGGDVQIATLDAATGMAGLRSKHGWLETGLALGVATALPLLFAPRRLLAVAALGLAIALGPFPFDLRNWAYLALAEALPPYERLYWPIRAVALLAGVAGVGAAVGIGRLPERVRAGAAAVVAAAVLAEAATRGGGPIGRWKAEVPEALACLEGAGVVLPYGADQIPLVWQTLHEAPMLNGMAERSESLVPAEQQALREENGFLRALLALPTNPRAEVAWTEEEKAAVGALGYRWVVLRPDALVEEGNRASPKGRLRAAVRALVPLLGRPVIERDDVLVYAPWGGLDACREGGAVASEPPP